MPSPGNTDGLREPVWQQTNAYEGVRFLPTCSASECPSLIKKRRPNPSAGPEERPLECSQEYATSLSTRPIATDNSTTFSAAQRRYRLANASALATVVGLVLAVFYGGPTLRVLVTLRADWTIWQLPLTRRMQERHLSKISQFVIGFCSKSGHSGGFLLS